MEVKYCLDNKSTREIYGFPGNPYLYVCELHYLSEVRVKYPAQALHPPVAAGI